MQMIFDASMGCISSYTENRYTSHQIFEFEGNIIDFIPCERTVD